MLVERGKATRPIDDAAADDCQVGCRIGDLRLGAGKVVPIGDAQISQLSNLDETLFAFLVGEPRDVLRPHAQSRLTVKQLRWGNAQSSDRPSGGQPGQRHPGIVRCRAGCIRASETLMPFSNIFATGGVASAAQAVSFDEYSP